MALRNFIFFIFPAIFQTSLFRYPYLRNIIQKCEMQLSILRLKKIITVLVFSSVVARCSSAVREEVQLFSSEYWLYLFISISLTLFAGLCSGLTVGYLSIKKQSLVLWLDSTDEEKVLKAKSILQLLEHHHLLLSTLLLANALAMEALPIFLDKIVPAYLAVIISVVAVLVFGELIPQAYCTGPKQIDIAYKMCSFVKVLQFVLGIFVKPIAWFLDSWLGIHQQKIVLTQSNLKTLLHLHNSKELGYRAQEIDMLQNTLDLRHKLVENCMIPIDTIFMVSSDTEINQALMDNLHKYNYSVIPVYEGNRNNIIGIISTKELTGIDINKGYKIKQKLHIEEAIFAHEGKNLLEIFDLLKHRKRKMCFILKNLGGKGKYHSHSREQNIANHLVIGIINQKRIFEKITLKPFEDDDRQRKFIQELSKTSQLQNIISEGVEQD